MNSSKSLEVIMAKKNIPANLRLDAEEASWVDAMSKADGYDNRSAWMRWLIRREWFRRQPEFVKNATSSSRVARSE